MTNPWLITAGASRSPSCSRPSVANFFFLFGRMSKPRRVVTETILVGRPIYLLGSGGGLSPVLRRTTCRGKSQEPLRGSWNENEAVLRTRLLKFDPYGSSRKGVSEFTLT